MPAEAVTREIFWNVSFPGRLFFYALSAATLFCFGYGIWRHIGKVVRAKPDDVSWAHLLAGLRRCAGDLALNRSIARGDPLAGWMHRSLMWGFVTLFIGTLIVAVEYDLFQTLLGRKQGFFVGRFFIGFELALDIAGSLFLAGLIVALLRRYAVRRPQLTWNRVDLLLPLWLLVIGVTGFLVEGTRLAALRSELAYSPHWSPGGWLIAQLWEGIDPATTRTWHSWMWLFHAALSLGWIAAFPYAPKVVHLLSAGVNVCLRDLRPKGRLVSVDVEAAFENDLPLGLGHIQDLTRKDVLDLMSCTECGRCEGSCPAHHSGKLLSPRQIAVKLRDQLDAETPRWGKAKDKGPIVGNTVTAEEVWACTTCMACTEVCPVSIDPLSKILELRRNEVMIHDRYPDTFGDVFNGFTKRGNPWNQHSSSRLEWARGLPVRTMAEVKQAGETVDYLLWVGCSAAFDPRNQNIARSLVKILQKAEVSFAVLGEEESCTGDPARRIGHEFLYQIQARQNVETLQNYAFRNIVTLCPHCFNCLGKEYPDFGGNYTVVHYTQLVHELLESGRLKLTERVDAVASYHDSCYLGRHNGIFDPPREILRRIPGLELVEMKRSRENGMCCGSGGGLMWIEEAPGKRVNEKRIEQIQEALAGTDAGSRKTLVASACPFCMTMLEDGLNARKTDLKDKDIAELVADAMGQS